MWRQLQQNLDCEVVKENYHIIILYIISYYHLGTYFGTEPVVRSSTRIC